ncbi:hypothetical protein SAMN04515674_101455 [Pseudarcicella hirudinis]|uniref:Uncharacterized protein n=1 Tax=Pseudarcicella hirudinis TaxID=1079859 RepID=A0A1I5MUL4_9BACT|nr:hypothetical protein [Pseudarcicella hirudinis]SFP13234.1 hypothetical protein SAMN04515674_101455 [Pseudarcicella hirudinis]
MKVLALVEIDPLTGIIVEKLPHKIYSENCSVERADSFFIQSIALKKAKSNLTEIERNQQIRLTANFEEIVKMGFIHHSEFEKVIEKKLIEIQNRITLRFYYDFWIKKPISKMRWRITAKVGPSLVKFLIRLKNGKH